MVVLLSGCGGCEDAYGNTAAVAAGADGGGHGIVQGGTAVADDGDQVRIAHFVKSVAFGEWMWLDREVVHVRDPLRRRLRLMTADAVLRVELRSYRLLVAQCDLVKTQVDCLS